MIQINEVVLKNISLPSRTISIVMMQPFVRLTNQEPFKWCEPEKSIQIRAVERTLAVAKMCDHHCAKTHFTLLPEYAIPGIDGINAVERVLDDGNWPSETVVIGGIEALTADEFLLLQNNQAYQLDSLNKITGVDNRWANCCITWIKDSSGKLSRYVQLKMSPAWAEYNINHSYMRCGKSVDLFSATFDNGVECRFFSVLCFDWIGDFGPKKGIEAIISDLNDLWKKNSTERKLNFVFLLQHNDKPNHADFLGNTWNYFEQVQAYPFVDRRSSVVVCCNTASGLMPGRYGREQYGYSAIISSPTTLYGQEACPPTYSVKSDKLRGSRDLRNCKDALLRENGACIHSLSLRVPQFIDPGPGNRALPMDCATVHAPHKLVGDPRLPGMHVAAATKWTNDSIDKFKHLLFSQPRHQLYQPIQTSYDRIADDIRSMDSAGLEKYIVAASPRTKGDETKWIVQHSKPNVDYWDECEIESLTTVLHSLSILGLIWKINVKNPNVHATLSEGKLIDIAVVSGETHEECMEYAVNEFRVKENRYLIVITKDKNNLPFYRGNILQVNETDLSGDPDITDPRKRTRQYSFQKLCSHGSGSCDLSEFQLKIGNDIKL